MISLRPTVFSRAGRASWSRCAAVLPGLLLLGTVAAGTCQAQKYTVTKLLTLPGGTDTSAARMNNAGAVVGSADDSNGVSVAVEWNDASPSILFPEIFPGVTSEAVAINNHGVVVGDYFDTEPGVFEIGPNIDVGQSYDFGIFVDAINDANVMVGDESGGHPALWDGVDISQDPEFLPTTANSCSAQAVPTGINSSGVIVGIEYDCTNGNDTFNPVAVRWKPDPTTHAPGAKVQALVGLGGMQSAANAVNTNGWVVGWATLANQWQQAVLWEGNSGPFDLGTLGGKQSSANAVNCEGDIAGAAQTASGAWHAVLWTPLHFKATDLNLEISETLAKEFTLTSASDTNDRGMVLADGVDNKTGAQESFVLSLADKSKCDEP
jgi:probable HAF family extracellular repeat protein